MFSTDFFFWMRNPWTQRLHTKLTQCLISNIYLHSVYLQPWQPVTCRAVIWKEHSKKQQNCMKEAEKVVHFPEQKKCLHWEKLLDIRSRWVGLWSRLAGAKAAEARKPEMPRTAMEFRCCLREFGHDLNAGCLISQGCAPAAPFPQPSGLNQWHAFSRHLPWSLL